MTLNPIFFDQARLLVSSLPQIVKEECFALKGGTAINMFVRDMLRLSVDIYLAYLPLEDRETSLNKIDSACRLLADLPKAKVKKLSQVREGQISTVKCIIALIQ